MPKRQQAAFVTVESEGTLFTGDTLQQIYIRDPKLGGMTLDDYHLPKEVQFQEALTRAWEDVLRAWSDYTRDYAEHPERHLALSREWILKLLSPLNYGRIQRTETPPQNEQAVYPVSHTWQHIPIHLVSSETDLDRFTKASADARRSSPYSMVQELLNRVEGQLWGFVSNGKKLRLLRKNVSMTRQAYIEFDLEAMMKGELYADFVLFWLLCHQSRLEGDKPEECWLEKWLHYSHQNGIRALDKLREGVQQAIEILGTGFIRHPLNRTLHEKLQGGRLDTQDYYRQVLRLVYRFIIVFVAEDRGVLFHPKASEQAKTRYNAYYSTARLRRMAQSRTGTQHSDLYQGLALVMRLLGSDEGYLQLGLFALNGFLFSDEAMPDLAHCQLANQDLLEALRALAYMRENNVRLPVDYQRLGSEELGSVYESLLELVPLITIGTDASVGEGSFTLKEVSGNERKTTGSYYTPTPLIDSLLDTALEPVLTEACQQKDREKAILSLKVCDPACGSGHFLVAAAYRIAKRLAALRSGELEPSAPIWRKALRDVVSNCIYGVDINPMSVELCKVRLWLEAIEPGKPLSFLDSHILEGNSLLGTTPKLLHEGIPDSAFEPIEGDDKKVCNEFKKKNRVQRTSGQLSMFDPTGKPWQSIGKLATSMMQMDNIRDDTVQNYRRKQAYYELFVNSNDYRSGRLLADAWCAAFVWKKNAEFGYPITQELLDKIERNPFDIASWMHDEIVRLRQQYKFFHWHLEFPTVFRLPTNDEEPENKDTGWCGGFDVVLANPPWERIKIQEKEWFALKRPDIAAAANAAQRRKMIAALQTEDPPVYGAFMDDQRKAGGESHFVRNSGRYPLCGRGDVNTYTLFAENMRTIDSATGRVGCIVPSGIATDDTTKYFFQDLMQTRSLRSLYSFENREKIFPAVHSSYNFCLLTMTGKKRPATEGATFVFFAQRVGDIEESERRVVLSAEDIALINPNTRTCPIFRSKRDLDLTRAIYKNVPILIKEGNPESNPWHVKFSTMFHMANDSHLFHTEKELKKEGWILKGNTFWRKNEICLPLYEGKMISLYDHRFGGYEESLRDELDTNDTYHKDPYKLSIPHYWVHKTDVAKATKTSMNAYIGFRNIARATDIRTAIYSIIPFTPIGHSIPIISLDSYQTTDLILMVTCSSSFIYDYVIRQKIGGVNLTFFILKQMPVLLQEDYETPCTWDVHRHYSNWIQTRAIELIYTSWDLEAFAIDCGYGGPPFIWDEERRFLLRCELDAAYFHLYDIGRADVDYIMETFPIVKRKDEKQYGSYRTKHTILQMYDEMQRAVESGEPYQTWLNPPPADPEVAHPPKEEIQA